MYRPLKTLTLLCTATLLLAACGQDPDLLDAAQRFSSADGAVDPLSERDRERLGQSAAQKYAWVTVEWDGAAETSAVNLDLHVVDANGVEINILNTGGRVGTGQFAPHPECTSFDCQGDERAPRETIYWELDKIQPGEYTAWVENNSERSGSFDLQVVTPDHKVEESATVAAGGKSRQWKWTVEAKPTGPCYSQLDQLGVRYERITIEEGGCSVEDAVMIEGPLNGITYKVDYDRGTRRFRTACETAVKLHEYGNVLKEHGISEAYHNGSFSCRNKRGGSTASMHSYALAMDFNGFGGNGKEYSVLRHWEKNTDNPKTAEGRVLHDIAHQAVERGIFNIVLTPNYNADHADHFHMDLTQGRSDLYMAAGPIGAIDAGGVCDHEH